MTCKLVGKAGRRVKGHFNIRVQQTVDLQAYKVSFEMSCPFLLEQELRELN